jgi:hypothetical protein
MVGKEHHFSEDCRNHDDDSLIVGALFLTTGSLESCTFARSDFHCHLDDILVSLTNHG